MVPGRNRTRSTCQDKGQLCPDWFLVINMGDEQDPPIVLARPFLNTTRAIIYIRIGEIHF
jgi:hypothetical protein